MCLERTVSEVLKNLKNSFVLLSADDIERKRFWVAIVLFLFNKLAFVHYMERTQPADSVSRMLGCVCLRCSISDEVDYTKRAREERSIPPVDKWFVIEPFSYVERLVSVVRGSYLMKQSTFLIHWSQHRVYINKFARLFEKAI